MSDPNIDFSSLERRVLEGLGVSPTDQTFGILYGQLGRFECSEEIPMQRLPARSATGRGPQRHEPVCKGHLPARNGDTVRVVRRK